MAAPPNRGFRIPPSASIKITLRNPATRITLIDSRRIEPDGRASEPQPRWLVELVRIEPEGLVLDVPAQFCFQGERVSGDLIAQGPEETLKAAWFARVVHVHHDRRRAERESIETELTQVDRAAWDRVRAMFENQQDLVLRAFKAIRDL